MHETDWSPSDKEVTVAMNLEMDGAWVASKAAPGGERWDTSKVSVYLAWHVPRVFKNSKIQQVHRR